MNGVKHIRCAPYHPSSNGAVERFMRTFKEAMKAGVRDGLSTNHRLQNFLLTYRTTPHATTKSAPCTLFFGRSIRTRLDLLRPDLKQNIDQKQAEQKQHHDLHAKQRQFSVGQPVMVRNLRPGPTWIPGIIVKQSGPLSYIVSVLDGMRWKQHVDHLRERVQLPPTDPQENEQPAVDDELAMPCIVPAATPTPPQSTPLADTTPDHRYPQRDRRPRTALCRLPETL